MCFPRAGVNQTRAQKSFPGTLAGVREAYSWVAEKLAEEAPRSVIQSYVLAISELGTNLAQHTHTTMAFSVSVRISPGEFRVTLSSPTDSFADEAALLACASDLSQVDPLAEHGRGLGLVLVNFPDFSYQSAAESSDGCEHYELPQPRITGGNPPGSRNPSAPLSTGY